MIQAHVLIYNISFVFLWSNSKQLRIMHSPNHFLISLSLLWTGTVAWQPTNNYNSPRHRAKTALAAREEATFGMGCFWKPSEELLKVPGVIDTVVGYTGVADVEEPPSYEKVCFTRDWVEGVRVFYDDEQLSYEDLLDSFFETQEPKLQSRQYASIIFPHGSEQEATAKKWLQKNTARMRKDGVTTAWTQIETLHPFFAAEGYHQRYWQKTRPRLAVMIGLIAISSGLIDSILPVGFISKVHDGADALVLAGLIGVLLERKIDTKTVRI